MFLGLTWAVAAAMVGFTLGRLSMYGRSEPEDVGMETAGIETVNVEAVKVVTTGGESTSAGSVEAVKVATTGGESTSTVNVEAVKVVTTGGESTSARNVEAANMIMTGAKIEDGETKSMEMEGTEMSGVHRGRGDRHERAGVLLSRGRRRSAGRFPKGNKIAEERKTWSVGSPVSGEVKANGEGGQTRVVIRPREDRLYAPAGGKITRLFPLGNAFLFTTEFGAELYIQAGEAGDELLSRYYRPRILQNEVVGKGKLLLEFDRQGLEKEGVSAEVSVCVENCCYGGDVQTTTAQWVNAGEEILQVWEPSTRPKS